mmetsp:Transcript_15328/g.18474  ORF Transcript_15328/g.18474 Transcript_15328/m.18474 type:complete len:469 (+) Transcript_15328:212-1618(+)|eukprot:CAMPEP_0197846826 /NCGR_PEP_ID=MMETSP1438-20131217/4499_1 /TAXON_ID=1461541 /ORGANISM="Pterosperma sp., Strain CCMP1384" /LENGTH=468 /DNA_ID=CAMNT_0043458601 /DNA_START=212 /DNA_END=1618 /DNA_ORIENTATION=-
MSTETVQPTGQKGFTWEELAEHNREDSLWVAIRGKVYDLTSYQHRHPGGSKLLRLAAGRDGTHLFEAYHPLKVIDSNILDKFEIGQLTTFQFPTYPPMSPFYRTLKTRVAEYMKDNKTDQQYSHLWTQVFRECFIVGCIIAFFCMSSLAPVVLPARLASCVPLMVLTSMFAGASRSLMGVQVMHDCSHGAFGKQPWLWSLAGVFGNDVLNGASFYGWCHQHMLGHHIYCNVEGTDPDIKPFPLRMSPNSPWAWYHKYQWLWGPIAYCLLSTNVRYNSDMNFWTSGYWEDIKMTPMKLNDMMAFWGGKLAWFSWQIILPLHLGVSWQHLLMCHAITEAAGSFYLGICFQCNHVADTVDFQPVGSDGNVSEDWAEMQARTTQDYGHGSWLTFLASGGLNYQVIHHMLPGVSQLHYKNLQPTIVQTMKEYNIPYNHHETFSSAVWSHIKFLYQMGWEPAKYEKLILSQKVQ